jgi:hypothetical protein
MTMSERAERDLLQKHGTRLIRLKPQNIMQAAERDLKLRDEKRVASAAKRAGEDHEPVSQLAPYAFYGAHVRKAKSVAGLIEIALQDREVGLASGKRMTRIIYGDEELLIEAARGSR